MILKKEIINLINFRIREEEKSSRLYKSMSIWLGLNGYNGASKLWNKYSVEEQKHADISYQYLLDLDIEPEIPQLDKPANKFENLEDIIELSYSHEMLITDQCNDLAKEALKQGDFMTLQLAQNYLKEQVEEIAKMCYWRDQLETYKGGDISIMKLIDTEMGEMV